jgi:hypothetical protein
VLSRIIPPTHFQLGDGKEVTCSELVFLDQTFLTQRTNIKLSQVPTYILPGDDNNLLLIGQTELSTLGYQRPEDWLQKRSKNAPVELQTAAPVFPVRVNNDVVMHYGLDTMSSTTCMTSTTLARIRGKTAVLSRSILPTQFQLGDGKEVTCSELVFLDQTFLTQKTNIKLSQVPTYILSGDDNNLLLIGQTELATP